MTIRILNPLDWSPVKAGDMLQLNGDHGRLVKIELNCEAPTRVDLSHFDAEGEERLTFLGILQGLDKIEVVAQSEASIIFSTEGEVWYCTNDGVATAVSIPDEASFTKLVGRKSRSDQLEQIIQIQQLGINRLRAEQEAERQEIERLEAELAAAQQPVIDPPAVVIPAPSPQPEPPVAAIPAAAGADDSAAPSAAPVPA